MIHTANEFVAKHHRHLLSGVTVGLKALEGMADDSDEGVYHGRCLHARHGI